jgi:excisionase family DNA binding protein
MKLIDCQQWLEVREVAAELRISEESIRIWIRSGRLAAIRAGRQYRISRESLSDFAKENATRQGEIVTAEVGSQVPTPGSI